MRGTVRLHGVLCLLMCMVFCWTAMVQAEVLGQINFQGMLTDAKGDPAPDDTYQITFSIYSVSSGGTAVWTETQAVSTVDGIYSVILGKAGNRIDPDDMEGSRFLGVKVENDSEMSPRYPLVAVPFSLKAADSEKLGGQNATEFNQAMTDQCINVDRAETMEAATSLDLLSVNNLGNGMAVDAESAGVAAIRGASSNENGAGIWGFAGSGNGIGVFGQGGSKGVHGYVSNQNGGYAIYGESGHTNVWAGYFDGKFYASGNAGIGTTNPTDKLHVLGDVKVEGDDGWNSAGDEAILGLGSIMGHFFIKAVWGDGLKLGAYGANDAFVLKQLTGNVGIGTANPTSKLDVNGTVTTKVLSITGGADIAEPFDIQANDAIQPGMVLTIDAKNPGKLKLSEKAYDRCVAGIISSAGGVQPGMIMSQTGTLAEGEYPIALTGRVYCWADAGKGPIQPGDLLTTSDTLGHAMKATNYARSQGAVLGKAMTSLEKGTGLVLVLVSLQ